MNFNDRLIHIYEESNMCDGIVITNNYNEDIENYLINSNTYYEKRIYIPAKTNNDSIYLASFKDTDT